MSQRVFAFFQPFKFNSSQRRPSLEYALLPMQPLAPIDSSAQDEEMVKETSKADRDGSYDLERSATVHTASEHSDPLHRNLKARHISMIAIGALRGEVDMSVLGDAHYSFALTQAVSSAPVYS